MSISKVTKYVNHSTINNIMVTLDKIALSVPRDLISDWRHNPRVYNSKYTDLPYHLYIAYNERFGGYKVEFSAKILGDRYPELINCNNIRDCLNAINALGICSLDVDGVINMGKVIGADFAKDIRIEDIPNAGNMADVKSIIRLSINNYERFNCANYRGGGMIISNAVNDKRRSKRLTIYDKADELRMANNRPFISSLNNAYRLHDYFRGRVRFELRATTQYQLRGWLGIRELSLMNVLESTANPLRLVMSQMFNPIFAVDEREIKPTLTNLDKLNTLKLLDWDLARVESHVRESTTRSVREGMRAYERLYLAHKVSQPINIVEVVGD